MKTSETTSKSWTPSAGTCLRQSALFCSGELIIIPRSSLFVSNNLPPMIYSGTDRVATQGLSASSGPLNPENRITAMFSKDPENTWFNTHLVYIYYNGDIPGAKYDSHSDPSMCYHIAKRMMDVIKKSGDEPLTVLPQASSWDLPPVQNPPSQTTSTSGDATHP